MVERVNRYRTSDGLLLETLEDARAHEAWLKLCTLIERMASAEGDPSLQDSHEDHAAWLIANRDVLIPLLKSAERHDS